MTEAQVLDEINRTARLLAPSFVFGYYDRDDIEQEARMMGIQAMAKYDPARPLPNFLYSHVRNRLINLRRDKFRRNDPPCHVCHEKQIANGPGHEDGRICPKYASWRERNACKSNLMRPLDIENVATEREERNRPSEVVAEAEKKEMLRIINRRLPVELRTSYLQMRDGVNLPKVRRRQVEEAVREILKGSLECPSVDA